MDTKYYYESILGVYEYFKKYEKFILRIYRKELEDDFNWTNNIEKVNKNLNYSDSDFFIKKYKKSIFIVQKQSF